MGAVESLFDGKRSGKREQTVLTGQSVVDFLGAFWGRTRLDPCAAPAGPVWVECCSCKGSGVKKGKSCKPCGGLGGSFQLDSINPERSVRISEGGDGLKEIWGSSTYVNPPYDDLAPWLLHEMVAGCTIWLVPVRPHRKWWRRWAKGTTVGYLNPQKFKGHHQTFPGPLCLGMRHGDKELFTNLLKDSGLGEVL